MTFKCVFVLTRNWPYGIDTECELDALDKHEKSVMKSFIVEPVFVTPWQIHLLLIQENTKYRYDPNVNYPCCCAHNVFGLSRIFFLNIYFS